MHVISTREFGLRVRLVAADDFLEPFVAIDTSVQIGASREEEVMLSTMSLSKEEAVGLHLALDKILRDWPGQSKAIASPGPDQFSEPYAGERSPHAHSEPVEPAGKEAP